jgi:dihydrolipoamide dehydrogenase
MSEFDVVAAFAQRDYMTSSWHDEGQLPWLSDRDIELVRGTGRLDGVRAVLVTGSTGDHQRLHSATVPIAGEVPLDRLWHAVPSFPTISEVWLRLLGTYGL